MKFDSAARHQNLPMPCWHSQLTKPGHQGSPAILYSGQQYPQRNPLKQSQHGGEEAHDGSISFPCATHAAHTSITVHQPLSQAAPWMQFVTGP